MQSKERSFRQIFGEGHPDPSLDVSPQAIRNTIYGASLLLQEDPSESAIVESIAQLAEKSPQYLDHAYDAVYYGDGTKIDESGPLNLMRSVVSAAHGAYDFGHTQTVNPDFDSQAEAEFIYDLLQLNGVEKPWKDMNDQLLHEKDPAKRIAFAEEAKQRILEFAEEGRVTFKLSHRAIIPTWENISRNGVEASFTLRHATTKLDSLSKLIDDSKKIIERSQLDSTLEQLPRFDKEQFDELRMKYGAKAANLIILQEFAPQINTLLLEGSPQIHGLHPIKIPDFIPVPVDIYRKWQQGENIDEDLRPFFDWTSSLMIDGEGLYVDEPDRYIVRSSAVHSEDGENISGAGIYESIVIDDDSIGRFDVFKNAVTTVFVSTNSANAKAYRDANGIQSEEMGLVIQRVRPDKYAHQMNHEQHPVTINSTATGIPGLVEIIDRGERLFVKKTIIEENLGSQIPVSAIHFGVDKSRFEFGTALDKYQIAEHGVLSVILEKIWNTQIQLECVGNDIVQIRQVTDAFADELIDFPDAEEIARGNGVGVGDKVLTVLEPYDDENTYKKGLVQFFTNYAWTAQGDNDYLPEEGAVAIRSADTNNAHLQTLCSEKGLMCIYPFDDRSESELPYLEKGTTVRVVSNGIEARIYKTQSNGDDEEINPDIE